MPLDPLLAGPAFSLTQHLEAARAARFGDLARISDSCLTRCDRSLLLALARDRHVIPAQHDLLYGGLRELGREGPHDTQRPWKGYEWILGHALAHAKPQPAPVDEVAALYQALPPEAWAAHGLAHPLGPVAA